MKFTYTANFRVNYDSDSGFKGFENIETAGYFEPGWNMNLLFHDIFEHWFEKSEFFYTDSLSQAGECVALGIRQFFYDNRTYLVEKFAAFNKYHGNEWNSWNTIIGQVMENVPEEGEEQAENANQYPNDFNYKTLKGWDKVNNFEGYVNMYKAEYYKNIPAELAEQIELAFSYGYWLGEQMFQNRLNLIERFCENLQLFLDKTGIGKCDIYEEPEGFNINGYLMRVKVGTKNITANFGGVVISANKSKETMMKTIKAFFKKHEAYYED